MKEKKLLLHNFLWCLVALLSLALLFTAGCRSSKAPLSSIAQDSVKYTKFNIHAQKSSRDIKASYAGYVDPGTGHIIIPAGSKVTFPDKRALRNGFYINVVDTNQLVFFEYHRGRMEMSPQEYVNLITSNKPVSLDHFSEIDRKGIKAGKVYTGMSKEGVLTAFGYPAVHGTPSLESDRWTYWRNRFVTKVVEFDSNGHVQNIIQ